MFVELAPLAAPAEHVAVDAARPPVARRVLRALPPFLYLAPGLGCLIVWTYRPLVEAVQLSFYQWNLLPTRPKVPVGLDNYQQVVQLPELRHSLWLTVATIVFLLPFSVLLPTIISLLTRRIHGRAGGAYRALVFAPVLVPPVASAAMWMWLLDPRHGLVDRMIGNPVNWLHERGPAQLAIIGITGWHLLGFAVLVVTAGLANINDEYSAAAQLDGATRRQITRWIILPLLSPTLVLLTLMTVLLSGQLTFPLIDALTQGGPDDATTNAYYLLWEYCFKSFNAGLASAAGLAFFLAFGLVALFLVWLFEKLSFHDN
ncbi:carbohydrate ABC transporter permease [Protofrankia coriariae]|uniref:Glycerol-3-phosphate ABC transporter permease n=1 Tax=Protofrankia coriariae TaxID=1562887 RepID=A0ABR5F613_9ACTN|nr:sugar ABC transporter permease [Protofrankia coriariae]KLL12164.1 glycerol-3-phosphate ABC transporter permease [Protofrankia coriariae]